MVLALGKDAVVGAKSWPSLSLAGRAWGLVPGFEATQGGQPGSHVLLAGSALACGSKGGSRLHREQPQSQINEVLMLTPMIYVHFQSPT